MVLFCVLGWLYARETPLLETPDEPSHFSIIQYMAEAHQLPPPPTTAVTWPIPTISETNGPPAYYAPPLYYAVGALLIQGLDTSGFAQAVVPNPGWKTGATPVPGRDGVNKNAYVHTADQRPPYAGWAIAFHRLRAFSLALGAFTVWGTLALGHQLWPRPHQRGWVWVATVLVAGNATYLFITNGITNDALLIPLCTWGLVAMVRLHHRPAPNRWWPVVAMGIWVGLAILTKQSAFILIPVGALAIWLQRERIWARWFVFGTVVLGVGGWWYLYNGFVYGEALGLFSHTTLEPSPIFTTQLLFWVEQAQDAFLSYWAAFGWALIFVHPAWYLFFGVLVGGSILGWLRPSHITTWPNETIWILGVAVALNLLFLAAWMWGIAAPYGRLLFPVMAPIACFIVEGWRRSLGDSWWAKAWPAVVSACVLLLAIMVPFHYLRPAFAAPLATPADLAALTSVPSYDSPYWQLVGYQLPTDTVLAGESVPVTLYWQLVAPPPSQPDLTVFVQLSPRNPEQRVASVDEWLGTARYPSSAWQQGEIIRQQHTLAVPATVLAPALYWFNVGLYHAHPSADNPETQLLNTGILAQLGPIRVIPASPLPVEVGTAAYADFADTIRLRGYDVTWAAEENTLDLTVTWEALANPSHNWHVFVHVLDETGQLIAQQDGEPRAGEYPTNWWRMGETIIDSYTISLPPATTPVTIRMGLYDWQTGQRPLATDAHHAPLPDNALLLPIEK